ncbi:MAG: DUF4193 family protein [Acidimicrobiia bacterium]
MSNEDLDEAAEPDLSNADVDEDELEDEEEAVEADLDVDVVDDLDEVEGSENGEGPDAPEVAPPETVAAAATTTTTTTTRTRRRGEKGEDDEDVLDLDEELHPDDVEEPLDVLLKERTASGALEEDDEAEEEIEVDPGETPTRIVPRRPGEFLCSSCFLVLPRTQLADEKRMLCRDCV